MREPINVKLFDYFENRLSKEYDKNKNHFLLSEQLDFSFRDLLISYWSKIILCIISFPISAFIIHSAPSNKTLNLLYIISFITSLLIYRFSFLSYTSLNDLHRLSARLNFLKTEKHIDSFKLDELISFINNDNPTSAMKKVTSAKVYYDLCRPLNKERYGKETNTERLYLLYLFLSENLSKRTTNDEFANIIGAILDISPETLKSTHLSELNTFIKVIKKDEITVENEKKVRNTLKNMQVSLKRINKQISNILDKPNLQ